VILSVGGLCLGLLVGWYLFAHLSSMISTNNVDRAYYILLIVLGLSTAAFLFGALRSTAIVSGRSLGLAVNVGGPAAGTLLVVVRGFWLTQPPTTFDLDVRLIGAGVTSEIGTGTWVLVDLGSRHERVPVNAFGDAVIRGIAGDLRASPLRITLESERFIVSDVVSK